LAGFFLRALCPEHHCTSYLFRRAADWRARTRSAPGWLLAKWGKFLISSFFALRIFAQESTARDLWRFWTGAKMDRNELFSHDFEFNLIVF